jgi:hypothetical protein
MEYHWSDETRFVELKPVILVIKEVSKGSRSLVAVMVRLRSP